MTATRHSGKAADANVHLTRPATPAIAEMNALISIVLQAGHYLLITDREEHIVMGASGSRLLVRRVVPA